jgi:hypothetical protein
MSFFSPYASRYYALKPIPHLLTVSLMLVSMILGSIIAVVLSWAWLFFTVTMLVFQALRMRVMSFRAGESHNAPVTIDGVYSVVGGSKVNDDK